MFDHFTPLITQISLKLLYTSILLPNLDSSFDILIMAFSLPLIFFELNHKMCKEWGNYPGSKFSLK